jgi:putative tryptophan/tyrosine transport system substrate-binding protein
MRRREFCLWLSAVTAMDLLSAKAQKPGKPVIGCLALGSFQDGRKTFDWVRRGLAETGFVEGRDFDVELRVADYQAERLRELAADLVARNVAIIVALTTPSTAAAEAITKSVPIVFFTGVDPVANGFVSSLNHPGGNATGIFTLGPTLNAKRLELLHEIAPTADVVAVLISSSIPAAAGLAELPGAAASLRVRTITQIADSREDFTGAFEAMARDNCRALYVPGDAVFNNNAAAVVALAAKYRMPAIYPFREYVAAGGLASYGPNFSEGYRFIGTYAGRILRGERAAELPVQQITKIEFVLNAKAAKELGLELSSSLLTRADEVIE